MTLSLEENTKSCHTLCKVQCCFSGLWTATFSASIKSDTVNEPVLEKRRGVAWACESYLEVFPESKTCAAGYQACL